jgi:tetratricopeptide (TPR) repeat protein
MRRINVKLLAVLVAVGLALGATVYVVHGVQVKRGARVLLRQADRAEAQGQTAEAVKDLERYLGYVPDDLQALARYGLLLESQAVTLRDRQHVLTVFEQVLRREPERHDIRGRLIRLAMDPRLRTFVDPRDHLRILLKRTAATDGELEQLFGQCEESNGNFQEAEGWYARALERAPGRVDSAACRAELLRRRLEQPQRADQVMDELVEANGGSFRASLARASYRRAWKLAGADDDLARARVLAPDEADVLLASAASELGRAGGDLDGARADLQRGVQRYPRDARMYRELARLELQAGQPEAAVACLSQGAAAFSGHDDPDAAQARNDLNWSLAELLIQAGKTEITDVMGRLRRGGVTPALLDYLGARLQMNRGKWAEAAAELERLRPSFAADPRLVEITRATDVALGRCYERLGEADQQYAACRRAVDLAPQDVPARLGLAAALAGQGKTDEAIEAYQQLVAAAPQAGIPLARLLILHNLQVPEAQRRWQEVEAVLDRAAQGLPEAIEVPVLRAAALAAQPGQAGRARDLLRTTLDRHPDRVGLWIALAKLAGQQGRPEEARPVLEEARRRLGDVVELRLAFAGYWVQRGGAAASRALAELARDDGAFGDEDRRRLLLGLVEAHARAGDPATAERLLRQLAQRPDDLDSRLALFDLALQAGRDDAMQRAVAEIRRVEEDAHRPGDTEGIFWRYARAKLLIWRAERGDTQGLEEARTLLALVAQRRPSWSRAALATAEIDDLKGNTDGAIQGYLRAIDKLGQRTPSAIRRVVQLLYERHRYIEADEVIRKFQDQVAGAGDLLRLAADVSLGIGDFDRALDLAQQAAPESSPDYRDQIWLGQVLWALAQEAEAQGRAEEAQARRAKAERALRRATDLAGDRPEAWVALVQYLIGSGQPAQAEAAVQEAQGRLAGAPLALAQCFEAINRRDRAQQLYREAQAAQPQDVPTLRAVAAFSLRSGQPQDAEPDLRAILGLTTATPEDVAWAKRVLAVLVAAQGDDRHAHEAFTLLDIAAAGDPAPPASAGSAAALRAQAQVLALQKDRSQRRRAIALLEGLREQEPPLRGDQFLLAQLYESVGDWPKASAQMLTLLATNGDNPLYVSYYAAHLLRHHEADAVRPWLARLEVLEPQSPRTLEIKARVLGAQGRGAEAAALLTASARQPGVPLDRIAALLEELGQLAAAEALDRDFVSRSPQPEAALVLVGFLARHGRLPEALDVCQRAEATCPPAAVIAAGVAALAAAPFDEAQARRVELRLERALRTEPRSAPLLFQLANLRSLQGRYQEAEALYRQSSQSDTSDSGPLNNLAWLLTLKEGKTAEALALIEQAIQRDGPAPHLLDTRAVIRLRAGQSAPAIQDLEEAIALAPSAARYFHLAQAYWQAKDRVAAAEAMRQAKAEKLSIDVLHPLERPDYQKLLDELALR